MTTPKLIPRGLKVGDIIVNKYDRTLDKCKVISITLRDVDLGAAFCHIHSYNDDRYFDCYYYLHALQANYRHEDGTPIHYCGRTM